MDGEWSIKLHVSSMTGSHEDYEEEFSYKLPDLVMSLLLNGKFQLWSRGRKVCPTSPLVDFATRTMKIRGESWE